MAEDTGGFVAGPQIDVEKAVQLNRQFSQQLGWQAHFDDIVGLLGLTVSPDEEHFAQAIAGWQAAHGLDADGILGPNTWAQMETLLGLADPAPAQIAWGHDVAPEFKQRVIQMAADLSTNPDFLMAAMAFETANTFDPSIENAAGSGAAGLIQFMPKTAEQLGTTTDALKQMTAVQQLDYVQTYFAPYRGQLADIEDVYMAILWPKAVGQASDTILFSTPSKAYEQNQLLDADDDGNITKAEAAAKVRSRLQEGQQIEHVG